MTSGKVNGDAAAPQTPFDRHIEELYEQFRSLRDGAVADYIPELAKVDPDQFGIAIVTVDGHVYQVGDSREDFSIQSISKAFTYGIALEDKGVAEVEARVDVEPSGEAFNSISLESDTGRPLNPMINAGAIATTGLVDGDSGAEKIARILEVFSRYSARHLEIDQEIYLSEQSTGHRNRAISHLLRNYDIIAGDPEKVLDVYFQQCSIKVNCRDLALMGATLANDGVNPITSVRALRSAHIPRVLGVMASCGMYDYSGNWIYRVGMPAKSGVGGGIVAVLPGQLGLAVFSPRLDPKGNSVRGLAVCEAVSKQFDLHMLHSARLTTASTVRCSYTLCEVRSRLQREAGADRILAEHGDGVRVLELAGDMQFVSAESVMAEVMSSAPLPTHLVLDFSHVTSVNQAAAAQLADLCVLLRDRGAEVILTGIPGNFWFSRILHVLIPDTSKWPRTDIPDIDRALEFCEQQLLTMNGWVPRACSKPLALAEQLVCRDLNDAELALLEGLLERHVFAAGETICREGEEAEKMYFVEQGWVSAWMHLERDRKRRLNAMGPGWTFGEAALIGSERRIAEVVADTPVTIAALAPRRLLDDPSPTSVQLQSKLYRNLYSLAFGRLRRLGEELRILTR